MTQSADSLESAFQGAWTLLTRNLIIVVPGLALALIAGFVGAVVAVAAIGSALATVGTGSTTVGVVAIGTTVIIAVVLFGLMAIAQMAFVTGMAGAAWERGTATLADGMRALNERGVQILYMILWMVLLGIVALILAPITIFLSLFAYLIFFIYVGASVIIGGNTARHALSESWHLAASNFWPTTGLAALIVCVSLVGAALGAEVANVQAFLGGLTAAAIQQAVLAYATLVIVGEYLKLRGRPVAVAAGPIPQPAPTPASPPSTPPPPASL